MAPLFISDVVCNGVICESDTGNPFSSIMHPRQIQESYVLKLIVDYPLTNRRTDLVVLIAEFSPRFRLVYLVR